jgi:hypothetical protein
MDLHIPQRKMSEAMPNALNEIPIKPVDLSLQLLTAILMTFAAGLVSLQLSVRLGVLVDNFDALTF